MVKKIRLVIGIVVWIAITFFVANRFANYWGKSSDNVVSQLADFIAKPREKFELKFDEYRVIRIGDPIFVHNDRGQLVQIGAIRQVESKDSKEYLATFTNWAGATMFSTAPDIQPGDFLTYHETPQSMDWVIRFMLPAEKREEIAALVATAFDEHSDELLALIMPILQKAVDEASVIVRQELVKAIAKRHELWADIGQRYRSEIIEGQVIPLVNDEIWPIVQEKSRPLLEQIGEEIWNRASIWQFGWRSIYDSLPLTTTNLTRAEFDRFVEQDAVPILTSYLPDFVEVQRQVLVEASNNPRVQKVLKQSLQQIANDSQLQAVVLDILREVFLENQRLRDALESVWNSDETQRVLQLADARIEPAVVEIGEQLFGSPSGGVTAEFARILRNKILKKDSRWLVLRRASDRPGQVAEEPGVLTVVDGDTAMDNPFYRPARDR